MSSRLTRRGRRGVVGEEIMVNLVYLFVYNGLGHTNGISKSALPQRSDLCQNIFMGT